jgi:NADH-quinone oxidoreductase subunit E
MGQAIDEILKEFPSDKRALITILHRVQEKFGYIPAEAITCIARHLKVTENELFGVLTFYRAFSLVPKGRHVVKVCLGTACHVRGGLMVLEEFERKLEIKAGQTTPDGEFTLETVNCIGCCAIGPVVLIDEDYHGHAAVPNVSDILNKYRDPAPRRT